MVTRIHILSYLRTHSWNNHKLEALVNNYEGDLNLLLSAAYRGRVALMKCFYPTLSSEDQEIASDILCPLNICQPVQKL